jgi:rifampin ADP-ribosylating transferase
MRDTDERLRQKGASDRRLYRAMCNGRSLINAKEPSVSASASMFSQSYFHGTRADLRPGDTIKVGHSSNFTAEPLSWVYFSGTLDAAIWGAELAAGDGAQRIYVVEPTGPIFDDPNLTDKKFPGNPSQSYRSRDPLKIVAEVTNWEGHSPEQVRHMKEGLARLAKEGSQPID